MISGSDTKEHQVTMGLRFSFEDTSFPIRNRA